MFDTEFLQNLIKIPKKIIKLKSEDISTIFSQVNEILDKERLLLEKMQQIREESILIGDIHGNLGSLKKFIKIIKSKNPKFAIFLGDIVDRGNFQLECLIMILALKILNPKQIILLRGNHETLEMNRYYGFYDLFYSRYQNSEKIEELISFYSKLPVCLILNEQFLCVHGGIPEDIDIIAKLKSHKHKNHKQVKDRSLETAIFQMMWNDPKEEIQGFRDSYRGPGIKFYGKKVFKAFMDKNNFEYLIRAHECFPEGYRWFFNNKLLSIFSSQNYRGDYSPNPASYAIIKDDKLEVHLL